MIKTARPATFQISNLLGLLLGVWLALPASAQTLPDNLTLTNINILGQPRTLSLYKRPIRSTNFYYLTWTGAAGYQTNAPPPVRTYRGTATDNTNTIVCAVIKPGGVLEADGFDYEQGKSYTWQIDNVNVASQLPPGALVANTPPADPVSAASSAAASLPPDRNPTFDLEAPCGCPDCGGSLPPFEDGGIAPLGTLPRSTYMPPAGGMQRLDLGVDMTHYCYSQRYGANADLALASIEHTVNLYDLLMARDALVAVQETVVVLRQDIFYVPTSMGDQLNLMTSAWKSAPLATLPWDQIHSFATEQGLFGAGGYAWGNQIGKDESPANVEALYHEAGHNWDVVHLVYGADTMGGNRPNHGPFSIDRLLRKRNESMTEGDLSPYPGAYPDRLPPYTHVDCASVLTNSFVDINVLTNDWDGNGNALTVVAFSTNTVKGGLVSWVSNGILRYTPAANYVGKDLFAYTVRDTTGLKTRDLVHVEVVNRNLAAHYAFEDATGKSATDSTGNNHPGKLQGATDFSTHSEPGVSGRALRVDSGGIVCDHSPLLPPDAPTRPDVNYWPFDADTMSRGNFFDPMDESCTMAFWFKAYDTSAGRSLLRKQWHTEQRVGFSLTMSSSGLTATVREFNGLSSTKTLTWSAALAASRWYHVALQFDRAANQARLYVDGVQRTSAALDAGRFIFHGREPLLLGDGAGGQVVFDEFHYYTKALNATEIQALYAIGHIPASGPSPADGERDVALSTRLVWVAGRTNYQHDVFFGTNLAAVAAATTNSPEYLGRRPVANYTNLPVLPPSQTLFWRVDEIFGGTNVAPGPVWSFLTAPDAIHGGLKLQLTLDARDTLGNVTYDRAGPAFNDGTLFNAPPATIGRVAEALAFNGTNHYVQVPALNLVADTLTLLAWVRRNGPVNDYSGLLFHRGAQVTGMNISTANRLGYHWNDSAATYNHTGPTLPDGQWALCALVVEPTRAYLYVGSTNGVLSRTTNTPAGGHALCSFDGVLRLASDSGSSSRYFKGGLDEIGIWNRALTQAEIGAILTNGMAGGGIDGPPPAPQPGTFTWTGNSGNLWNDAGNWAAAAVPGAADFAIFDESSARNLNTELGMSLTTTGIVATGKLRALGIASSGGHSLTLNAGGIQLSNSFTALSLAAPVSLGANQTWSISEFATLNVSSNVAGLGRTLTFAAEGNGSLAGTFNGAGALIKRGAGTLTMSAGGQSFTGGLTVSNGTLRALGGGWAQSFFANVSPRSITVHSNATLETTTHSLGGLGASFYQPAVTLNDGATWQLNAEQYLNSGNLILKGAAVSILANDLRLLGGTVAINASSLPAAISGGGSITLHGDTTFNVANGPLATDATIGVPIGNSGNRALTKSGAGTLALTEVSTFNGPTTVSAGTLALRGGKDTLPQSMAVSVNSGATLDLNNYDQTLASLTGSGNAQLGFGTLTLTMTTTQSFGGVITGSPNGAPPASGNTEDSPNPGGFTKSGTGKLTLTANQNFTGDTLITSGILALSGSGGLGGSSNIVVTAALDVTARTGGSLPLATGQTLKGKGTVLGAVTVNSGSAISPGESIGTLTTGGQTWMGGGSLLWEITHATNPGSWDRLTLNGALSVGASAGNPFSVRLLAPGGPLAGFNNASNYSWIIATTTGGMQNFAADKFTVDSTGLGVNLGMGSFGVELQGNNLVLAFNPAGPAIPPVITGFAILGNGSFSLSGTGAVSQAHVLMTATNLLSPIMWTTLATNLSDANGVFGFTDTQATNHPTRFYRVTRPW
jgi:autotransporter-associated beta strand protein